MTTTTQDRIFNTIGLLIILAACVWIIIERIDRIYRYEVIPSSHLGEFFVLDRKKSEVVRVSISENGKRIATSEHVQLPLSGPEGE
jgi:hypothetical protein